MEQIAGLFLVHIQIAVAGDTKEVRCLHMHSAEKQTSVFLNNIPEKNIVIAVRTF